MENINHPPSKPFVLEPDAAVPSIPELTHISCDPPKQLLLFEEGIEVQQSKAYGVGIDCHSKFIQVSVIVKRDLRTYEYRREYNTDWNSLTDAHDWIIAIISSFSSPPVDMSKPLHYCIESTSTYHIPVIMAFDVMGHPSCESRDPSYFLRILCPTSYSASHFIFCNTAFCFSTLSFLK